MANKKSGSLDTNTLLRLVLGDIPEQTRLVEELIARCTSLAVADIALFEMIFVLEKIYHFSRADVVTSTLAVIRHPKINCNRKLFERVLPDYQVHTRLSIVDCALVHYATVNGCTPLYTFDRALVKQYPDTVALPTIHAK